MNLILYVDFKSNEINNDFKLSNALISEHTVLLVTNEIQLEDSYKAYDLILVGRSAINSELKGYDKVFRISPEWDNDKAICEINEYIKKY